jgi:P pilus assembly chaperone PapD
MSILDNFVIGLRFKTYLFALIAFFFITKAANSNLTINPVSLEFSPKVTIQEITMENQSTETKAFELSLKRWQQDKNEDIYSDTNDIILFPLASKIPPHSKQKFRLILKNLPQNSEQIAYRLFFFERSYQTRSKDKVSAINFLLNMTVPVFVTGSKFIPIENTSWAANVVKKDSNIILSLTNNGSKFLKIRNITAKEAPSFKSGDWQYVLPAATRNWTIPFIKKATPNALTISYASVESFEEVNKSKTISIASVNDAGKTASPKAPNTKVASTKP